MNTTTPLEEALALVLRLAPKERLQLIEQVASSVEREIEDRIAWGIQHDLRNNR